MQIEISTDGFKSESAIEAEIRRMGLYFMRLDVPPVENTSHWHNFSSIFYIMTGSLRVTDVATGNIYEAGPGTRVSVPERTLHAERSELGYSIMLGVTRDPTTFDDPVERSPDELLAY